jgi:hypothetical protein
MVNRMSSFISPSRKFRYTSRIRHRISGSPSFSISPGSWQPAAHARATTRRRAIKRAAEEAAARREKERRNMEETQRRKNAEREREEMIGGKSQSKSRSTSSSGSGSGSRKPPSFKRSSVYFFPIIPKPKGLARPASPPRPPTLNATKRRKPFSRRSPKRPS